MGLLTILAMLVRELSVFVSFVKNHTFPQPLTHEQEEQAILKMQEGDESARNLLIEHNLRLVAHIVKKYDQGKEDADDLISIGTIGLIKGIQTFKPEKGVRLATYAARCIENEILMHMRALRKVSKDVSIHESIGQDKEGNEVSLLDILGSEEEEIVETIQFRMDRDRIYNGLAVLDHRERQIIWARFGLPYGTEKTQREIARELGISRSYVSRIEKRALHKLQEQFMKTGK
ncbi:RNA polymerase sporulation sigma factor SigK [Sulfoacidibacillus thermotolerans]|uniref:RNA polymerase sigma factor n=1 Tax=Sulfoacidibacillus thermotolerans TaxID=1765684 RepID=A0A2U3D7D4_SULT2|nr:RNA polymerase sporulation sigma factor SigK [Sulfoacidibacillus thermotolerans]PWI57196.1 sporulation sigma factor SigK [Sulfoacidibacillus thermotolerans]